MQQPHEQPQMRVLAQRGEACEPLLQAALVVTPCDRRSRAVDLHHEQRGDEQQGGHEPEDQIDAGDGQ